MDLTILGASGSFSSRESQCSGYLLRQDGFTMWMDAGNGTLSVLQQHVALGDVSAIWLSHVHPDHSADMYPFFYALLNQPDRAPVPVFTPPGVRAALEALIGPDSIGGFRSRIDWREVSPGGTTETGPLRLEAFDATHSVPNNTVRVTADGRTLCYSGDTGPNAALARAAAEVDLFLCEASWVNEQRGLMGPIHLAAGEAGEAARAAGARRLLLTHMWATNDRETARAQAADAFGGAVELAIETGTTTV